MKADASRTRRVLLSQEEFDVLADLKMNRRSKLRSLAQSVLVGRERPSIVADGAGVSRQQLANAVSRLLAARSRILDVYNPPD